MPVPVINWSPVGPSRVSVPYSSAAVELGDVTRPQAGPQTYGGQISPEFVLAPAYAGPQGRQILEIPAQQMKYTSLAPAPGSEDLVLPRDSGSVPGTAYENIMYGPVSGYNMDHDGYQVGHIQVLMSVPPGAIGPVTGGEDYATLVSNAQFQAAFEQYSNLPSSQAIVSAI